jgi:hypothetical protein
MPQARPVTLQINVAPTDLPHAVGVLPHQLRQWAGQVEEILFTLDLHRTAHGGRFGEGWEERRQPLEDLLERLCQLHPDAHVRIVDYGADKMAEVAERFLGARSMPAKDTKGAPFYPYFHGLHTARHDLVLHLDSDLMFGGGSQTWTTEALDLLEQNPDVLACSPLPGPPMTERTLRTQSAIPFPHGSIAFRFSTLSTRLFLIDRRRMCDRLLPLTLQGPVRLVSRMKARLHGNPPYRAAELLISDAMGRTGLLRVDFLGAPPGMWSLHPPFRSEEFYQALPGLIRRVEDDDVPDDQRGDYDLNDSMLDMSAERRRARWRRLWA